MKIVLMVQNLHIGGVQRLVVDEANELEKRGHEVWVIFFEGHTNGHMADELRIPSSRVLHIPYRRMRNIGRFFILLRTLQRIKPHIVMTHLWFANTVGRLGSWLAHVPCVLAFEHSTYDTIKSPRQLFFDRLLQYVSTKVVAVSEAVKVSLLTQGIRENNIAVINNGVCLENFSILQQSPLYFLYIGRLVHDKGVDVLLHAIATIKDVELIVVGDGPEKESLTKLAESLHISSRVFFKGPQRNPQTFLKNALALVLPSRREGFGLVLVEALAAGVPVIATHVGGIVDIVSDDFNGLLVQEGDSEALAHAIQRLTDEKIRIRLASHAQASAAKFSIRAHIDAVCGLCGV